MAAVTRNAYAGAPVKTTITAGINATDTSIVIASATGWPTGAQFPVVIDPSEPGEEKVIVTRAATTLTVVGGAAGRGYDDTVGASHASGAVIYPCISANEMDDANLLASTPTARGDLITVNASITPTRLAVGAAGTVLTGGTDPAYTTAANLPWTWTAWTPDYTYGGAARTPGTPLGRYWRVGGLVTINFSMTSQSTESGSAVRITGLPVTISANVRPWGVCRTAAAASGLLIGVVSSTEVEMLTSVLGNPGLTAGAEMAGTLTYEAA